MKCQQNLDLLFSDVIKDMSIPYLESLISVSHRLSTANDGQGFAQNKFWTPKYLFVVCH